MEDFSQFFIKKVHITQKSTAGGDTSLFRSFIVDKKMTKHHIKRYFKLMGMNVITVNIVNIPAKKKVFNGKIGFRSSRKKAVVKFENISGFSDEIELLPQN
ncbi:50S ribosomal protein L23 [Lyticum sinuosum]|uniref:50S ribosomal protein L23 n=1 Tax=Lyticum sinuosum TaxID=1332059 RepID=A0AAE4VM16_9RICK|nr:50S ribosomal protein L23 [Lyticum sinuosum]MDZ5761188.1 50S ribosomal protein L23 [Lyticum sinuosum]